METLPAASIERLPPHNLEAEQSLLGSLLIDRDAIIRVASFIKPDDFYHQANGLIYRAIFDLYNRREPTDFITLSDELGRRDQLDQVGGIAYLTALLNAVPTAVHVEYYGRIVERTATLRRLIDAGAKIVAVGYRDGIDTEDALDEAERAIFEVSQKRQTKDFVSVAEVLDRFFDQIDYMQQHRGEVVGVGTGFSDLDQLLGGLQRSDLVIVAARPSMGKCLTAESLIDDPATGERLTIEACVRRRLPAVLGLTDAGTVRPTAIGDWIDSGIKPCVRVTTRSGRQVETTYHHPFMTVEGWQPIVELRVGDRIAVPRVIPVFGSEVPEPWLPRLLAYFIAEGGLTGTTPQFSNADPEIIEDFLGIIRAQFPGLVIRQERVTYSVVRPVWRGKPEPNPVTALLRRFGLWGKGADVKRFPAAVWTWNPTALMAFLRVLFSCDGTIYAMAGYPRIEFTVASPGLADDVQHALLRFGIISKRWRKTERSWRVEITEPDSVNRFNDEIGWIGEKSRRVFPKSGDARRSNNGHPPVESWAPVRAGCRERGLSFAELGRRADFPASNPHMRRSIPRLRLSAYAQVLDDPELARIASDDIYWDEIIAIEDIGERRVFDLTIPDGANFIANDIVVHNTSLALGMAYGASVGHGKTVGMFSLEMSAEQLVQRLLSMETGVDAHRLRLGQIDDGEWDRISRAFGRLAEAKIYIDDQAGASVMDVRSKARRLQAEYGLDLVVIDYLQLMSSRRSENRVQEISEISRGLKGLARELNVPVIALSQLSRAVESRSDHRPMLSDLRESGCLTGDTPVFLPDEGGCRPIAALVGQSGFNVLAVNPLTWRLDRRQVLRAFPTGVKPVFRLTTRLGRTIRATANHQFLTIDGWRRLDALHQCDRIAVPREPVAPSHHCHPERSEGSRRCRPTMNEMPRQTRHDEPTRPLNRAAGSSSVGALLAAPIDRRPIPVVERPDCGASRHGRGKQRPYETTAVGSAALLAESDVYWDEVVSIEADGIEDVYDLTVEDLHNFVAADIIVHNSIEQDADVVLFIYREDKYEEESDKKGIAEIIIAKHRNGPVGSINLRFFERTARFADLEVYRGPEG
jgi:replicative DNA helicase